MRYLRNIIIIILPFLLVACSSTSSRYSISDDIAPDQPIQLGHIEDAHPKYEPISRGGNKNYSLKGESYSIIKSPDGFKQSGQASWYGKKFHGHQTSNGEVYDMYSMSAAHKTLPIPSYVKVRNLDNGKSTIVRVNDRGPFHAGRIIDLSYAAAYKLDMIRSGTANVEIEYITVPPPTADSEEAKSLPTYSIQTASSNNKQRSRTLAQTISQTLSLETHIETVDESFRIMVGPYQDYAEAQKSLQKLKTNGYPQAFIRKTMR